METRKKSLRQRPLLIMGIILLIIITAGVWAWRHFPSAPEDHAGPGVDTLQTAR